MSQYELRLVSCNCGVLSCMHCISRFAISEYSNALRRCAALVLIHVDTVGVGWYAISSAADSLCGVAYRAE